MEQENLQAKVEQTLKDIHVLFSKCETYNDDKNMVIVDKRKLFRLLEQINLNMYEMMDACEVTQQSHARGERKSREKGERIIEDATQKADDIYSAAVLYTDEALGKLNKRMSDTMSEISKMYEDLRKEIRKEDARIKENREELRNQLEELKESEKYLKLLEKANAENAAEGDTEEFNEKDMERHAYHKTYVNEPDSFGEVIKVSAPKPVIKVDPLYEDASSESDYDDGVVTASEPKINVNLDAEYFKWKNKDLPEVEEGIVEEEDEE